MDIILRELDRLRIENQNLRDRFIIHKNNQVVRDYFGYSGRQQYNIRERTRDVFANISSQLNDYGKKEERIFFSLVILPKSYYVNQ